MGILYGKEYVLPDGTVFVVEDNMEVYEILDDGSYFLSMSLMDKIIREREHIKERYKKCSCCGARRERFNYDR